VAPSTKAGGLWKQWRSDPRDGSGVPMSVHCAVVRWVSVVLNSRARRSIRLPLRINAS
jgi:hypothetical protein